MATATTTGRLDRRAHVHTVVVYALLLAALIALATQLVDGDLLPW
jgi:hypothetical protein